MTATEVPPMSARALVVRAGQLLRIVDVAGGQPGDLVVFHLADTGESFSQARTRVENRACRISTGHQLWSGVQPPRAMMTITADSDGGHDLLYTACCRYALEKRFGVSRDGCHENLARALAPYGVASRDVPDPLNLFFDVNVAADGGLKIGEHDSAPGAFVELRAEIDCLVAVATCAVPRAGRTNSHYLLELRP